MKEETVLICCGIVHVVLCALCFVGMRQRVLRIPPQMFPLVVFLPVFGFAALLAAEWLARRGRAGLLEARLEDLRVRADSYRIIWPEEEHSEKSIVPLEEAILINDTALRRKLMLDILRQDPARYIELLKQARLGGDVEVTHYASTAMMELQREFELELQKNEKYHRDHPEDPQALDAALDVVREYIESGMLQESALFIQRVRYGALLKEKMEAAPDAPDAFFAAAGNEIELGNFDLAAPLIGEILKKWPDREEGWMLRLKYCHGTKGSRLFQETMEEMVRRDLYISPKTRELLDFWNGKEQEKERDAG